MGDRIVAPNLTRIVHEYSDQELEAVIRHGVRPDGSSVVIMPSAMFANVSDEGLEKGLMSEIATGRISRLHEGELAALHTYLQTLTD